MTEQRGKGGEQNWFGSTPVRVGGIAVLLVLAEIAARARAGSDLPHVAGPSSGLVIGTMRTVGVGVLGAGLVLLIWGRKIQRMKIAAAAAGRKAQLNKAQRKRMILAIIVGFGVAVIYQIILQLIGPPKRQQTAPPPDGAGQPSGQGWIDQTQGHMPGEAGIGTYVTGLVAVVAVIALAIVLLRRSQLVEYVDEEEEDEGEDETVARAVVAGQAAVQDEAITDPRAAIVACFAAMERALARVGGEAAPTAADTPREVLRRGIDGSRLPEEPAQRLLDLFQEARFSTHPMGESDRDAADRALTSILDSLGAGSAR